MPHEYYTEFNATLEAHGLEKLAEETIDALSKEAAYRDTFIATCLNEGMTKEAAAQLYKEAAGGILKGILTVAKTFRPRGGVLNLSRIGRASRGLLSRIGARLFGLGHTAVKGKGLTKALPAPVSVQELPLVPAATSSARTTTSLVPAATSRARTTTSLVPTATGRADLVQPIPAPSLKVIGQPVLDGEVLGEAGTAATKAMLNSTMQRLMKWAPYIGVGGAGYMLGRSGSSGQPTINFSPIIMPPGSQTAQAEQFSYLPGAYRSNGLMYGYG